MKRFSALLALAALATSGAYASTAGTYVLSQMQYGNDFAGYGLVFGTGFPGGVCIGCGISYATDDGAGNIAINKNGASSLWYVDNTTGAYQQYSFGGNATTTLGGDTITWSGVVCNDTTATAYPGLGNNDDGSSGVCEDNFDGLDGADVGATLHPAGTATPVWKTGKAQNGVGNCSNYCFVSVTEAASKLFVSYNFALFNTNAAGLYSQNYTMVFDLVAVPVPGAVWLFGSALGLLGFRRQRR